MRSKPAYLFTDNPDDEFFIMVSIIFAVILAVCGLYALLSAIF